MKTIFTLTPAESKRLLSKAVCQLPEVKDAQEEGKIIVSGGTTNAYIAEEMSGESVDKSAYTAGIITRGRQCITSEKDRIKPLVLENGAKSETDWTEVLNNFTAGDVFIKGGNAVDNEKNVGVLLFSPVGGTIAKAFGITAARGSHLILPVGLEKMIPDVISAADAAGNKTFDRHIGKPCGLMPVTYGKVITEIEAVEILSGAEATCIGAGGVGGSEGAVVLAVEGEKEEIDEIMEIVNNIKGEEIPRDLKQDCNDCGSKCEYRE